MLWGGRWNDAYAEAERARTIGQKVSGPYIFAISSAIGAYAQWQMHRHSEDLDALVRASQWIEGWGIGLFLSLIHGWVIDALASSGRVDEALHLYRHSRNIREPEGERLGTECGARALAVALARRSNREIASPGEFLTAADEEARRRGSVVQLAWNRVAESQMLLAAGRTTDAARMLANAAADLARFGIVLNA